MKSGLDNLYENSAPEWRHLIGKRIQFRHKGKLHAGRLEFIGYNKIIRPTEFQITVDRCPMWSPNIKSIRELKDGERVKNI